MLGCFLYGIATDVRAAPYVLGAGTYRSAAVNAQLIRYARDAGMREGETAACQANFKALLSMVTPWLYSYLCVARRA